jgi:hypothetical protein
MSNVDAFSREGKKKDFETADRSGNSPDSERYYA